MTGRLRAILCSSLLIVVGLSCGMARAAEGSQAAWIRAERMKATYSVDSSDDQLLAKLKEIGINTIFLRAGYNFEQLKPAIANAEMYGFHVFLTAHFRGGEEMPRSVEKGVRLYVGEDGVQARMTGCPLDVRLWDATIFDRALPFAEYGREHPLAAGFLSDIENYGAYGEGAFEGFKFCYCEGCLADFFKAKGINDEAKAIPAPERKKWLESRGLLEAFQGWEHEQVERVCRSEREKLDAINPDFLLGAYPNIEDYELGWDMARGFATERAPFVSLPENTYGGFRLTIPHIYTMAEQHDLPFLLMPGIFPRRHIPLKLATDFYLAATLADGYWIYLEVPPHKFFVDREMPTDLPLYGTPAQWRQAISLANREIRRHLRNPLSPPQLLSAVPLQPKDMIPFTVQAASASPGVRLRNQSWSNFFRSPIAGHQVLVQATAPGGCVAFDMGQEMPEDNCTFFLNLSQAPNYGIIQMYLNGEKVGGPIDCYSARPSQVRPIIIGKTLLAGRQPISFRIVGKNPKSSGYDFGAVGYRLRSLSNYCKDWMVLGPFPVAGPGILDVDYLQGWKPDGKPGLTYVGKGGINIEWRPVGVRSDGYVAFADLFPERVNAVAYAYTWARCPQGGRRRLWINGSEWMRMWLNGAETFRRDGRPGFVRDFDFVDVDLKPGWNSFLFAVGQRSDDWLLRMRVSDPGGEVQYSVVPE